MKRIAILGPESSGKTTLAKQLSEVLNVAYISEFARTYLEEKNGFYEEDDLVFMAQSQYDLWEEAKEPYLIADTEMLTFKIWSEFKYHRCSSLIRDLIDRQKFDHYFLCSPDIPWEHDSLRENPDDRDQLFELYRQALEDYDFKSTVLSGTPEKRIHTALKIIENL